MKSIHTITQDRPIVNATDDTSDALLCACTLAQPVCITADNPTANSGRGAVNARRSIRGVAQNGGLDRCWQLPEIDQKKQ